MSDDRSARRRRARRCRTTRPTCSRKSSTAVELAAPRRPARPGSPAGPRPRRCARPAARRCIPYRSSSALEHRTPGPRRRSSRACRARRGTPAMPRSTPAARHRRPRPRVAAPRERDAVAFAHASRRLTVVSPMPRLGTLSTRLSDTSSAGFDDGTQVGERVLDLAPVVEARAADDLVGDADSHELLLEHPGLRVRAVEDGDVAPAAVAVVVQPRDLLRHPARLVALVLGVVADDRLAAALVGPQLLRLAAQVVGDDRVGGVEDRLGRAVVLVEHDHRGVGERLLELEDVADVRAAEPVDRLVGVADHADVAVLGGEHHDQLVLGGVRVLVLVDEHVAGTAPVVREHLGVLAEQLDRLREQVVEVHGAGPLEAGLVLPVDLGDPLSKSADARSAYLSAPRARSWRR